MKYHDLSESTLTPDERFKEKNEILELLEEVDSLHFTENEHHFLEGMRHSTTVSVKQLFWLRDIKNKYL